MPMDTPDLLNRLGISPLLVSEGELVVSSPIDGALIGRLSYCGEAQYDAVINRARSAFAQWRNVPAPRRGELIRLFGNILRTQREDLARLVSTECGKNLSEGRGEVQEMIDICDFAVGQSRQLYGLTIASERPDHHMREAWHPLGPVGIISAFNFPVAVWSWNATLAIVCGNPCVWKPSEKTPLTALAVQALFDKAMAEFGDAPEGLSQVIVGDGAAGKSMAEDTRLPLISATGSTAMGRHVGAQVAERFGRSLLELGGNNAAIVCPSADLELTVRALCFSAAGTAGQRCTSLRRLFLHRNIYGPFMIRLKTAYQSLSVGNPLNEDNLIGPLIDEKAYTLMVQALEQARAQGGNVTGGERLLEDSGGFYVRPAISEMAEQSGIMLQETFAPILYAMPYDNLDEAIRLQNAANEGLSSCIFTLNMREAEQFLSASGSDCGIANVNIGPSGAEIGGAFGGEKETGGGRESGSDAWKAYMRRQTQTVNYSTELPLAQGVRFEF